jgi:hypothetical protein
MNHQSPGIASFVRAVRRRVNRHRFFSAAVWSVALAAGVMVVVGLSYVLPGHAVPPSWYILVGGAAVVTALAIWAFRRVGGEAAARFADRHFALEDTVISCRHFAESGRSGGFYDLQAKQTETRVSQLEPAAIKYRLPRRVLGCALLLGILAVCLGFKPPSDAVRQRIALEKQTHEQTEQINQQLEDLIDELEESIEDAEEQELIDPNQLREWVDELKETADRKEALRQYARFEKKLTEASSRLQERHDEQLLDRAAGELDKDRETRELAERLKQKNYEEAAKQLKGLRPKQKQLSEQRKELARLKAAAHRMTTAAREFQQKNEPQLQRLTRNKPSEQNNSGKLSRSSLEQDIQDLEDAVEEWDDALDDADLEELECGEWEEVTLERCEACQACVGDELDELAKKLCRLGLKKRARKRLSKLCRACSQCQSALCNGPQPGGKKAGVGSNTARRDETDELIDNDQYTRLKGTQGKGPSTVSVEAAEDGSGVSTRRHVARARNFRHQVESFVQREDVPQDVRAGVKEYFQNIHEVDESSTTEDGP